MFDYKNIEAFAMVIIEKGFEKASQELHITQSAVSQRVKQLEDQYGQILLIRSSPPEPTAAGLELLVHYRKVKQLENDVIISCSRDNNDDYASISIAVNADTLATWFFTAVSDILAKEKIVLDIHVDDQDLTHQIMQAGQVWGCISTRSKPIQGCKVDLLGYVRYGIFGTEKFKNKWFPNGLTANAFEVAPMARYNRKDDLNNRMFQLLLNAPPVNPPTFFVPSTEIYGLFVSDGRCYGILPEQQSSPLEEMGTIVNLSPEHWINVALYWHSWNLKSKLMESFNSTFIKNAAMILRQH